MNTFSDVCKEAQDLANKEGKSFQVYCNWGRWTIIGIDAIRDDIRFVANPVKSAI